MVARRGTTGLPLPHEMGASSVIHYGYLREMKIAGGGRRVARVAAGALWLKWQMGRD